MKGFKEFLNEVKYNRNTVQFNSIWSGYTPLIRYGESRRAGTFCAIIGWPKKSNDFVLFSLNSHDKAQVMGTILKADEVIYRYVSNSTMASKSIQLKV